jgi:hypothetical protein
VALAAGGSPRAHAPEPGTIEGGQLEEGNRRKAESGAGSPGWGNFVAAAPDTVDTLIPVLEAEGRIVKRRWTTISGMTSYDSAMIASETACSHTIASEVAVSVTLKSDENRFPRNSAIALACRRNIVSRAEFHWMKSQSGAGRSNGADDFTGADIISSGEAARKQSGLPSRTFWLIWVSVQPAWAKQKQIKEPIRRAKASDCVGYGRVDRRRERNRR